MYFLFREALLKKISMRKKDGLRIILVFLLLADTAYTFRQHQMEPLDGDMPSIVRPAPHYEPVLSAPFGWAAATGEATYASPNRFFVHWAMYHYFRWAPATLNRFVDKVDSITLSSAIAKSGAHLFLLLLLAGFASRGKGWPSFLLAAVLMAPLFQSAGYYNPVMGIIEPSPTYTFFYAWPSVLLLSWLALVWRAYDRGGAAPSLETLSLYALTLILPFTGPLIPGVIAVGLLTSAGYGFRQIARHNHETSVVSMRTKLPLHHWIAIALIGVLGAYSLYLGTLSTEQQDSFGLWDRYQKLPGGLWKMLTNKPGLSILILGILLQFGLLRWLQVEARRPWAKQEVRFLLVVILLYLLLIPLGGYRDYRPDVVRRDTLQPVLLILFYLWGRSSLLLFESARVKAAHILPALGLLLLFTIADLTEVGPPSCQERTLRAMSKSEEDTIAISPDCRILTWPAIPGQDTRLSGELLVMWGILEEGQRFKYED